MEVQAIKSVLSCMRVPCKRVSSSSSLDLDGGPESRIVVYGATNIEDSDKTASTMIDEIRKFKELSLEFEAGNDYL